MDTRRHGSSRLDGADDFAMADAASTVCVHSVSSRRTYVRRTAPMKQHPLAAVSPDITREFPSTSGMPNKECDSHLLLKKRIIAEIYTIESKLHSKDIDRQAYRKHTRNVD